MRPLPSLEMVVFSLCAHGEGELTFSGVSGVSSSLFKDINPMD